MSEPQKPSYKTQAQTVAGSLSLRHYAAWSLAAAALIIALVAAYTLGRSHGDSPAGTEILLPTPSPLLVQVSGAVNSPGLVTLRSGDRVSDAISAAGGTTRNAQIAGINLAAFAVDGSQVFVPSASTDAGSGAGSGSATIAGTPAAGGASADPGQTGLVQTGAATASGLINVNTASVELLETLPNIGPTRANAIVAYRNTVGGFSSIEQLDEVSGIGPATLDSIRPLVTLQ